MAQYSDSEDDVNATTALNSWLQESGDFDSAEESARKVTVLGHLNAVIQTWICAIAMNKGKPASSATARICTFGSYSLGVNLKDSDIDTVCLIPNYVSQTDCFSILPSMLERETGVTNIQTLSAAFVPLLTMRMESVEFDILFVQLPFESVPDNLDLNDSSLIDTLDSKSLLSLNGVRVTNAVLHLVPNVDNFRVTLRAIKYYARKRGIYSNSLGYLGGISWAILVARVCQLNPNAAPATLVQVFFKVFMNWEWPTAVVLKKIQEQDSEREHRIFNPEKNPSDRYHLMPIVTPVYPQQNSAFNVNRFTKSILLDEFRRGFDLTQAVNNGNLKWSDLFRSATVLEKYDDFVLVGVKASTEKHLVAWAGYVESKLRLLVKQLETNKGVKLAHLSTDSFGAVRESEDQYEQKWLAGLIVDTDVDVTDDIMDFIKFVETSAKDAKLFNEGMLVEGKLVKREDLILYVPEEALAYCSISSLSTQDLVAPPISPSMACAPRVQRCKPAAARVPRSRSRSAACKKTGRVKRKRSSNSRGRGAKKCNGVERRHRSDSVATSPVKRRRTSHSRGRGTKKCKGVVIRRHCSPSSSRHRRHRSPSSSRHRRHRSCNASPKKNKPIRRRPVSRSRGKAKYAKGQGRKGPGKGRKWCSFQTRKGHVGFWASMHATKRKSKRTKKH